MSLLGRADECAVLDGLIDDIPRGQSRSLVLRGEAGIGKTALLKYLVESASDLTVRGRWGWSPRSSWPSPACVRCARRCSIGSVGLPTPQRHALEIAFGLSAGAAPDRFLVGLAGLESVLGGGRRASAAVCGRRCPVARSGVGADAGFVARRLLAEPVGIVFAARDPGRGALSTSPSWRCTACAVATPRAAGLGGCRSKLDERVRDRIIAETAWNPLALLELPRGDGDAAGGRLRALGRAGSLRAGSRRASFGDSTRSPMTRGVWCCSRRPSRSAIRCCSGDAAERLGIGRRRWGGAKAHGLLAIEERVTFRHPLVRSAVYRSATDAGAPDGPSRAGGGDRCAETDPDRRAWHLAACGAGTRRAGRRGAPAFGRSGAGAWRPRRRRGVP